MGISHPDDPLRIQNFEFLPQECTSVSTDFDEDAQSNWMEDKAEAGLYPDTYARVWAHTHPMESASPSSTDWDTFQEAMGQMPWGVMLILGSSNEMSCVFRVKEDMVNIPVQVLPKAIPEQWSQELENIKKHTSQWEGYSSHQGSWQWDQSSSSKFKRDIKIPDWETKGRHPQFSQFRDAARKLTGSPTYIDIDKWEPSIEEILSMGPCRSMGLLIEMYRNTSDRADEANLARCMEKAGGLLAEDKDSITDYDIEIACWSDPLSMLYMVRKSKDSFDDAIATFSEEVTQHIYYDKKKKQAFINQKYEDLVPDQLTSGDPHTRQEALNACITAALYFPEYGEDIDKSCRNFVNQFINQKEEYQEWQNQHEATGFSDIQV